MSEILYLSSWFALLLPCVQTDGPRIMSWQRGQDPALLGPKIALKSMNTSTWTVKGSAAAVEKAERVLGLARGAHPATAELIKLMDDDTPFLTQYLIEKPIWQVVVRELVLDLPSATPEERDPYVRTIDVLVRPQDGRVVRIRSRWPNAEPPMPPEPRAYSATCQIYGSGFTVYHGFPKSDPRITFLEALDSLHKSGEQVLVAKQISARYVMYSDIRFETPRPVWAITERGVPPTLLSRAYSSTQPKYEYRLIVDTETGKFLGGTNVPRPDKVIDNEPPKEGP